MFVVQFVTWFKEVHSEYWEVQSCCLVKSAAANNLKNKWPFFEQTLDLKGKISIEASDILYYDISNTVRKLSGCRFDDIFRKQYLRFKILFPSRPKV